MRPSPCLAVLVSLALGSAAGAQLAQPGLPASARHPRLVVDDVPAYVLPRPDVERLMAEDEARNNWPARYGAVIPAGFSSDDAGRWDDVPSGELVWRVRLVSPGARSLGLLFDRYELPESGKVFIHGRAHGMELGAFTRATRQPNGMLAVQPVLGDDLTIEYVQDAGDPGVPVLRVGEVIHDYRGILDALFFENPVALLGGGCLIDVNCPIGDHYKDIKRSVLFMLFSGSYCSAGLLNNTSGDGTPYFLTANHCGDMTNGVAVFGYERTGCDTGGSSQANTISGATLLAASDRWDSQLYLLSAPPPRSFMPFFAGWDRNTTQPPPAISISHPSGLPKKIARDDDRPSLNGTKWQVIWEVGKLMPGSSGSPLFNGVKRVIGPACCVSGFTCDQWANYGRFGGFYDRVNLGQWLDPVGANPMGIDGFDPFHGQFRRASGAGPSAPIYVSKTPAIVGRVWRATIDTSGYPSATSTWVFGYPGPSSGTFTPWGELLVDTHSPRCFLSMAPALGGISRHAYTIPDDPALIGRVIYTQGLIFGRRPLALTNEVALQFQ
jgi:lysyl endopeptidase